MNKHTPTPWKIQINDYMKGQFICVDGVGIAQTYNEANARYIIKAVNNFDLILTTLKQAIEALEDFGCEDTAYYKQAVLKSESEEEDD